MALLKKSLAATKESAKSGNPKNNQVKTVINTLLAPLVSMFAAMTATQYYHLTTPFRFLKLMFSVNPQNTSARPMTTIARAPRV